MKNKLNKVFALLIICVTLLVAAVACDQPKVGTEILIKNDAGNYATPFPSQFESEFGETFRVPAAGVQGGSAASIVVTDPDGKPATIQYGLLRTNKQGDYTVTYTADGLTKTITLRCVDTIAPVISLQTSVENGIVGELIDVPYYTASDKADIDIARSTLTVYAPDGTEATVTNGKFLLEQRGQYRSVISVYDNNGVCSQMTVFTRAAIRYVDENIDDGVVYDFDEADYTELLFDVEGRKAANRQIVTEGYPEIVGEGEDNGVLAIYDAESTPNTMQDLYTTFRLNDRFNMGERRVSALKIRFAVSTTTDYVHVMRGGYICHRFNEVGGIEPGVWHEMIIDPLQWGYYKDFDGFVIKFRDKGQTVLYIDEISFVTNDFVDDLTEGSLGDFDEEQYLTKVYQNLYCDPTTQNSYCVDGTEFEHLTEGYPAANPTDATLFPGLGASGGVIKFTTSYYYGGITYMFPHPIEVSDTAVLTIRVYSDNPQPEWWAMGFFNGDSLHTGYTYNWRLGTGIKDNTMVGRQWVELSFTGQQLKLWTADGKLTGIFIQARNNRVHNPDVDNDVCTMYIDEIAVKTRASEAESDWVDGEIITSFTTDTTTKNVVQPFVGKIGYLPTAEQTWVDLGDGNGALKITSHYAGMGAFAEGMQTPDQAYGDGAIVLLDQNLEWYDLENLGIKYHVEDNSAITAIKIYAVCPIGTELFYQLGQISVGDLSTDWAVWNADPDTLMEVLGQLPVSGLAIIVEADSDSANNVVYVDEITLHE